MKINFYEKNIVLVSIIVLLVTFSGCRFSASNPNFADQQHITKTKYIGQLKFDVQISGQIDRSGIMTAFTSVATDLGNSVTKGSCPGNCNLHVTTLHILRNGSSINQLSRFASTFISLLTLGIIPSYGPENDITIIIQYILPDQRVFIKSYNISQFYWGNAWTFHIHPLFSLNEEECQKILEPVFKQFFSDYEMAEETNSITSIYELISLDDGRSFYLTKLSEKAGQTSLQMLNGNIVTVPTISIKEKKKMTKPVSLFSY